ncbi:putative rna binding protein ligatin [Phaeomoniella chlamydospora]|uniref:Putative rna binding protein ligatin n=1 Tax=Phaeomoniella chlamydospora TaxID=158046 RepID=A0A0G2ERX3_PHACM|nr:putative rna binding protein ligatin [Phaeomoniella chlamydospora]
MGKREQRLYPTVYTLWHNPELVPLLHTPRYVVEKLHGGADLMTPGLARGPPFPNGATRNAIVGVASLDQPSVPLFVGICEIDISILEKVQGAKGHAVKGVHWVGDEIWNWSEVGSGGRQPPNEIAGWDEEDVSGAVNGVQTLSLEAQECDEDEEEVDGGAPLDELETRNGLADAKAPMVNQIDPDEVAEVIEERELTTKEIDDAFHKAFLYGIYSAKQSGSPPHYGIEFPIQPSPLVSQLIQPYLPVFSAAQAQQYSIKKTSWKNTKKFIKHLEKQNLCLSKDRNGGETVILDVDFDDRQVKDFVPYRLPKSKVPVDKPKNAGISSPVSGTDSSVGQKLNIQTVYRASAKLVPDLIPSKADYYTSSEITAYLKTYLENSELLGKGSSPRFAKLDPFLANNVLGSNSSAADTNALAAGEITRDALARRILEDRHLCSPYWVLLRDNQKWSSADTTLPKPKAGSLPQVVVTIEKRTGTKVVSKVANAEIFGINPELLANELQKKCASSTSVGQLVGGKPGMLEVLVQGDQRATIEKELARRGIDRRWVDINDKTKKKKN